MLWKRVVTAVVLLLVLLPALFYPSPEPFVALTIVFIAAAGWEWAKLVGYPPAVALANGGVCAVLCLVVWASGLLDQTLWPLWSCMAAIWVIGGAWLLSGGVPRWSALPNPLRLALGIVLLVPAWVALAQARIVGVNFLLSIMTLVWAADIFAYVFGRAFGGRVVRRKLAPGISPGKSWEGVAGGMLAVVLLALVWRWLDNAGLSDVPSLFSRLFDNGYVLALLAAIWLSGMSVVGDLTESLLKRSASVKDSSGLLPGHGGVLDRIDALLPTLPLAMLVSQA